MRFRLVLPVLAAAGLSSIPVAASGPLARQGEPITTSSYSIDLFGGPVLAGSRITGLGGSYIAIGEGVEGDSSNPAAPSIRVPWSVDWFDYDLTLGATFPSSLKKTDFDNNGTRGFTYSNFLFMTAGGNLQIGALGLGLIIDNQTYQLEGIPTVEGAPPYLNVSITKGHALSSYALLKGQLVFGAGVRFASFDFRANDDRSGNGDNTKDLFITSGGSPEVGAIWAPHRLPVRVGLAFRGQLRSKTEPQSASTPNAEGDTVVGVLYMPKNVELPWEAEAGISFQLGQRKLNVPWVNPHDVLSPLTQRVNHDRAVRAKTKMEPGEERKLRAEEDETIRYSRKDARERLKARAKSLPRSRVLITASVLVTGNVPNAVGVESFLQQRVDRSGRHPSVTPRLGIETEAVPNRLLLRFGSYLEPTRFSESTPRLHATGGFEVRMFPWSVFGLFDDDTEWRAGAFADGTRDYFAFGLTLGVWH